VTSSTPGEFSLYVSVLGIDQPHQAYETTFIYGDGTSNVPDAWRFDPPGCQGSSFITINHLAPAEVAKSCPSFQGGLASVQVKDVAFVPPSDGYAGTNLRVSLFNAYPPGVMTVDRDTRYFLMRVLFYHNDSVAGATTPGVDCGGWETPMCFRIIRAIYLDLNGTELPFGRNVAPGAPLIVTFNGLNPPGNCGGVPAHPTTWGAIKHQYR